MSGVFWEILEPFVGLPGRLFQSFGSDVIYEGADLCPTAIRKKGAPVDNCIGFLQCTNIQSSRTGGSLIIVFVTQNTNACTV